MMLYLKKNEKKKKLVKAPSIYPQACLRFLSPIINHHIFFNRGTVSESVSPLLHTAALAK